MRTAFALLRPPVESLFNLTEEEEQTVSTPMDSDDLITTWLAALRASGRSPATVAQYALKAGQFRAWLGRPVDTCTRLDARRYMAHLLDTRTRGGAALMLRVVKAMFGWAVREEILTEHPFRGLSVKAPEEVQSTGTAETIDKMLQRAKAQPKRLALRDTAIIVTLAESGLRRGELGGVTMADVDLNSGMLHIRQSKTRRRIVPLSDRAIVALSRWLRFRGTKPGSLWGVENPAELIGRVVARHSNGELSPHSLRRAFVIRWLGAGGSETSLVRLAGWTTSAMARCYVRASADALALDEYRRLMGG